MGPTKNTIRKIKAKKIGSQKWRWLQTAEMTFDQAIQQAKAAVEQDETIYTIKILWLGKGWSEEFSGDRNFNYIGVSV